MKPDQFFNEDLQERLAHLMQKWRLARDAGENLPSSEQNELTHLVNTELMGARLRAAAMAKDVES